MSHAPMKTVDPVKWEDYRLLKRRLLRLALGLPFIMGLSILLSFAEVGALNTVSFLLWIVYILVAFYNWCAYVVYPCPGCGKPFRGRQLIRQTCPTCGVAINP